MKKIILLFTLFLANLNFAFSQNLSEKVYQLMQDKCMSCHSNAEQLGGLDLEGSGPTATLQVYNNLVGKVPSNSAAAALGDQLVYPGRPDKSFLFRKINIGLEPTVSHNPTTEGAAMPPYGQAELTSEEKELIRQWILLGAPATDAQAGVSTNYINQLPDMIADFYGNNGDVSFPSGPPPTPEEEGKEGFQIKMGPFYLNPAGQDFSEMEFYQKYELDLPDDVDVDRIDMKISPSSHHFILYNFEGNGANIIPEGLRTESYHNDISIVTAVQEETDLRLPEGTAFNWDNDIVLDLNSHYINYSATSTYQSEVYFNVYTQPSGTAAQEMFTELFVKGNIPIPNNGNEITHTEIELYNAPSVYVWGLMGHTHQWGTDYKAYLRNTNGNKGELIYDASCPQGTPGCAQPFFDYQHIPIRYFEPLYELPLNPGFIHEAKWINNGPNPVNFGPTSQDEMMVLVMMYTESLDGVVTSLSEPKGFENDLVKVYPNPMYDEATVEVPESMSDVSFVLYNTMGQEVQRIENITDVTFTFSKGDLNNGLYIFRLENVDGRFSSGKVFIE